MKNTENENNKVVIFDKNYNVLNVEFFPDAETAYNYYKESIKITSDSLKKGETVIICRYRWDMLMTFERVEK